MNLAKALKGIKEYFMDGGYTMCACISRDLSHDISNTQQDGFLEDISIFDVTDPKNIRVIDISREYNSDFNDKVWHLSQIAITKENKSEIS